MTRERLIILRTVLEKMVRKRGGILNRGKDETFNRETQDLADLRDFIDDMVNDREYWSAHASR